MTTIAQLGIAIDSSSAKVAVTNLDEVTRAAGGAEEAAAANEGAWSKVGAEFEEFAKHARAHVLSLAGATEGTRAFTGILAHLPAQLLLAGAAIALLTAAYSRGEGEAANYAKSLALTGNAAGVTVGQLALFADRVGNVTTNTHEAADALAKLASTGAIGGQNLQQFAIIAIELQEKLGQSIEDTAKNFADLANDPLAATQQLGRALGYLTPELYDQIRAYEQQGDTIHAASLAQQAYADASKKAVEEVSPNLGYLERAWNSVKNATSSAASAAASIGRRTSPEQELSQLTSQRGDRQLGTVRPGFYGLQDVQNDAREQQLQKFVDAQKAAAQVQADTTQKAKDYNDELARQPALLQAAQAISKAYYDAQTQDVQRAYTAQAALIQAQDDLLEEQRSAGILEDQQYYAAKIALIQKSGATQAAEIDKEIALAKKQAAAEDAATNAEIGSAKDPAAVATLRAQQIEQQVASQQKLKDLSAQRAQVALDTSTKISIANLQEGESVANLTRAYADLVAQSESYNESLRQQYQETLRGVGAGDATRGFNSQIAQFRSAAQLKLDENTAQLRNSDGGPAAQQRASETERIIKQGLDRQIANYTDYYKQLQEKQSDWLNGAKEAFNNYIDQAKNVAGLTNTAFTNSFKDIEDSLVNLATTGKFSFHDLANSILGELIRIEVKILESQVLSSIFSAFGYSSFGSAPAGGAIAASEFGGGFTMAANGAQASAGQPFIIGERGPELFVPSQSGTIVPNGKWQGGGGGVTIVNNNNFGPGSDVGAISADLDRRDAKTKSDIFNSIKRGEWNTALRASRA